MKFATKSTAGTGTWSLHIKKHNQSTHGGKMWGKNNYPEGKGATFGFSLPLHNEKFEVSHSCLDSYYAVKPKNDR